MTTIKLNERSLDILKNFSSINPSIVFHPGQDISTISIGRKIIAKATIEQTIDTTFGIYDLKRLFNAISLFEDPSIKIEKHFLTIGEGERSLRYMMANPADIKAPGEDVPNELPSVDVEFAVTEEMIKNALNAAGVLSQPHLVFQGDGSRIILSTQNVAKPSSETYSEDVGDFNGGSEPFKAIMKVENLKLFPGDYVVKLCRKKISQFVGTDVSYIIAVESESTF